MWEVIGRTRESYAMRPNGAHTSNPSPIGGNRVMTRIMRRIRGLCLSSIQDLNGNTQWCEFHWHAYGQHRNGRMTWGERTSGIRVIVHDPGDDLQ